ATCGCCNRGCCWWCTRTLAARPGSCSASVGPLRRSLGSAGATSSSTGAGSGHSPSTTPVTEGGRSRGRASRPPCAAALCAISSAQGANRWLSCPARRHDQLSSSSNLTVDEHHDEQ